MKDKYDIIKEKIQSIKTHIENVKVFTKDYVSLEKENKVLMWLSKAEEELNNGY